MRIVNYLKNNKILLGILVVGFLLRIYKLDFQSPWGDELFTMINSSSKKSFLDIFDILKSDVHPPLYYYIVHIFYMIFGDSSFIARLISVIFGISGLIVVYYLSKELFNKRVGLLSIALLTINHFHIYYSQEARMYTMLFFSTALSFLYLIRFIKKPTYKTAFLYGLFSCFMIYTHFFALFTLISQYLILLYFLVRPCYLIKQNEFFKLSLFSGIISLILYIPALIIFFTASKRESFWIPVPEKDVYTVMFKEFFGFSEIAIYIIVLALLWFFIKLFSRKEEKIYYINPATEKQTFAFFILFSWIIITLFIPYILSYINLPIIISRYFINILPALIILIASGFIYMKNTLVRSFLIITFLIYSFTDVVYVKDYYNRIMKTQYREVSEYIVKRNTNKDEIFSSFEYYFSYYLNGENNNPVIKKSLNEVAQSIKTEPNPKSFWYVDINGAPDKPTDESLKTIDNLYVVDDNITLFDSYAKHYCLKSEYKPQINTNQYSKPFKDKNGAPCNFSIEVYKEDNEKIEFSGWAYLNDIDTSNSQINLGLLNLEYNTIPLSVENINRTDVTTYFKSKQDLSRSGFKSVIQKKNIEKGTYKIIIEIVNKKEKKNALIVTDKTFIVG